MITYYTYKMVRDYGFAPNPFNSICTLATCKPRIRKAAKVGDWIIGCGAKSTNLENKLIYLMKVSEKLTFEQYWSDSRFQLKKPVMNVGLKRMHGDNIYYKISDNKYGQLNSQHSKIDGNENPGHVETDTSGKFVLLSDYFFYFGDKCFDFPAQYSGACSHVRDFMKVKDTGMAELFVEYIQNRYRPGRIGDPIDWKKYKKLQNGF